MMKPFLLVAVNYDTQQGIVYDQVGREYWQFYAFPGFKMDQIKPENMPSLLADVKFNKHNVCRRGHGGLFLSLNPLANHVRAKHAAIQTSSQPLSDIGKLDRDVGVFRNIQIAMHSGVSRIA